VLFSLQKKLSCYETQQLVLGTGTAIWWLTEPRWPKSQASQPIIKFFYSSYYIGQGQNYSVKMKLKLSALKRVLFYPFYYLLGHFA